MPPNSLTLEYRTTPTGPKPLLDVYVENVRGKEAIFPAIATPHRQRTAMARESAEAIELSPGAAVTVQIVQPRRVHNAAMNGHGNPGAPWGPTVEVVPDIDPSLGQPGDIDPEEEWIYTEALALGNDFLGYVRATFDGPAQRLVLLAA